MNKTDFRKSIKNYLNGLSSYETGKRIENFLRLTYRRSTYASKRLKEDRESLKEELWDGIHKSIYKQSSFNYWKVAASLVFVLVAGAVVYKYGPDWLKGDKMIELHTGLGERKTVILSDGSVIKMNSLTTLRFPEKFSESDRVVTLDGEAYFDVEKNPSRPFLITSKDIETTVLGTSFNIRAYTSEEIDVTVAEGKVKVTLKSESAIGTENQQVFLIAGEQGVFSKGVGLVKHNVDDMDFYTNWKSLEFDFDLIPFHEALEILERAYNVQITLNEGTTQGDCLVKARFKNKDLDVVLSGLQHIVSFDYKRNAQRIDVSYKGCVDESN